MNIGMRAAGPLAVPVPAAPAAVPQPHGVDSRRWLAVGLTVALGLLGSLALAALFAAADARIDQAQFGERARDASGAIAAALGRATAGVGVLQGYMAAAARPVSRTEFLAFAAAVRVALPLELREVGWAPRIEDAGRDAFEQAVRADGLPRFAITQRAITQPDGAAGFAPAPRRAAYFPVLYTDPAAAGARVLGYDFISEPRRRATLRRASDSGHLAATPPLHLDLMHPEDGSDFIIAAPVFGPAPAVPDPPESNQPGYDRLGSDPPSRAGLRGAVLGILDTGPLIERVLASRAGPQDLDVYLFDAALPPGERLIHWHAASGRAAPPPTEAALRARPHLEAGLLVADRALALLIARPPGSGGLRLGGSGLAALLVGLSLTAGVAATLVASLRHALRLEQLTRRLRRAAADLASKGAEVAHLARHDALTGLANRAAFHERLRQALDDGRGLPSVLCLDLDGFKTVNDSFGQPAGDALLGLVAARLCGCLRPGDVVARMGGDEFAILLPHSDQAAAEILGRRLVELLGQPYDIRGNRMAVGVSVGIACPAGGPPDADLLLRNADAALRRAKQAGGSTWCCTGNPMQTAAHARRTMEASLRRAVAGMAFELHYQPQVRLSDRRVSGCEALLRWTCPTLGRVSPAEFVPVAEACGLIVPIGEWVLRTACAAAARWPGGVRVAVNVSAVQFTSPTLVAAVRTALAESGLAPARLELEITESVMLQDSAETLATLRALKRLGVSVSMDDFGTGYSSLGYLCKFPFDTLKIDQSFVRDLPLREDCRSVVRAVIGLCRNLGITTIAEGVETEQQLQGVLAEQCDAAQGYLISRPVPLSELAPLLAGSPQPTAA